MTPPDWLGEKNLAKSGVLLFGAGAGGLILHEFFSRTNIPVRAFLDNYSPGRTCLGLPVFQGTAGPAEIGVPQDTPLILSMVNFSAYGPDGAEACREQARRAGWRNVATRPEWLAALFADHKKEIECVSKMWADEKSRVLYRQALQFLTTRSPEHEPPVQPRTYFASDVPAPSGDLRWIQGGAYTGDSLSEALALGLNIDEAAFFEPELKNFSQLAANVRASGLRASCWPCGLWETAEALRFTSGRGADSAVDSDGDALIQGVDLDSALPNFAPNLITLDVEGAELKALEGMRRTIVKHRPNLAISIYHRPDDWWILPQWLYAVNQAYTLQYTLYLRVHAALATDAILYAVRA